MDDEDWDSDLPSTTATSYKSFPTTTTTTASSWQPPSMSNDSHRPAFVGRGRLMGERGGQSSSGFGGGAYRRDSRDSDGYNSSSGPSRFGDRRNQKPYDSDHRSGASGYGFAGRDHDSSRNRCEVDRGRFGGNGSGNRFQSDRGSRFDSPSSSSSRWDNQGPSSFSDRRDDRNQNNSGGGWGSNGGQATSFSSYQSADPDFPRNGGGHSENSSSSRSGFGFARRDDNNNTNKSSDQSLITSTGLIDWDAVRSKPLQNFSKFKDQPPVLKDFYEESPEIAAMSREEVKEFRAKNFNIMVELFKKEKLTYTLTSQAREPEDTRTPEEKEDYLFQVVPKPVKTIEQAFRNYPGILEQCRIQNFVNPTPIQSQLWPILLKGLDCIGIAQTGTGKTLAFLLPALIHIEKQPTPIDQRGGPNVLIMAPTRELAIQIEQEVKKINYKGIKSVCVYGGGDRKEQISICDRGVSIVIATPGRLYDLIQAKVINVTTVTYLVLDEADRMLDMGFEPQIMKILLDIRPDRQTVMTSATWPQGVRRLATKYLNEPIQLYIGTLDLKAAATVTQKLVMVGDDEKKPRLMDFIQNEMEEDDKLLVFVSRKAMADNLSCDLILQGIQCQCIHGDRTQCDREDALQDFKDGRVRILIATDIASRGIDIKDVTCVINFDFPTNIEEYVHRVGRTGRAGRTGKAVTFMSRSDWKHAKELIQILTEGQQEVPKSLVDMSERYDAMLKKRAEEGGDGHGRGGGGFRRGGFGGGGGFGGFGGGGRRGGGGHRDRDNFFAF